MPTDAKVIPEHTHDKNGFACIGGWLYTEMGMMIFSTNKKCSTCFPETPDVEQDEDTSG